VLKEPPLIAVIDDDEPIRKALSRLLRTSGLRVQTFSSGQAFLESLLEGQPDCAVLDFHMPDLNGLDVLNELRSRQLNLPVIIITAYDEPSVRANCRAAGASGYLSKPIDEAVLRRAIIDAMA
jgi:CheY-like chemotaxis protein